MARAGNLLLQAEQQKWNSMSKFPRCPAHSTNGRDLILLDSNIAGTLTQIFQGTNLPDAMLIHELRHFQFDLGEVLNGLKGECLEYFEELGEIASEVLKKLDAVG